MLGKLKGLFGSGSDSSKQRIQKVNIQKRFSLVSEMFRGSMSRVYRAVDRENGRTICLKVQNLDKNAKALSRTSPQESRPSEGEITVRVAHPRVVKVFEYGETTEGEHYLAMELIDGVSFQFIRENRAVRTVQKLEYLAQAAEGLAAVHKAGIIHHDINQHNFLIDRESQVKLIDFGLAVPNTAAFRKPGNRTGTMLYMAPELIRREAIDERIDVYAFGVLAFELLTGRAPFEAGTPKAMMLQRLNSEPLDPAKARSKLSDEVCDLLRRLTAKRPEDRWPTMANLAETLRTIPPKRKLGSFPESAQYTPDQPSGTINTFDNPPADDPCAETGFDQFWMEEMLGNLPAEQDRDTASAQEVK